MTDRITVAPFDGTGLRYPDDIAALHLDIRREQQRLGQNRFDRPTDSWPDLSRPLEYYVRPGGNFWVARCNGVLAGFVGLRADGELRRLAVAQLYQGRGVGGALAAALMRWARGRFTELTLTTGFGEQAMPIYLRCGFVVTGIDQRNQDFLMRADLLTV